MVDWLFEAEIPILYSVTVILIVGAAEFGIWLGARVRRAEEVGTDISTLTGAALGLLGLLLAFSFSLALSRYDSRQALVLEEANAIGSTANFARMLPEPARTQILDLLRDYIGVRIGLGVPYSPAKMERDIARSVDLQDKLWQQAMAVTAAAPQSLPAYRFVASLNEMNNIHESRLTALRYQVPGSVMFILITVAMVAMGLAGYQLGAKEGRWRMATLVMSLTVAMVVMLIVDLDRPARGLIRVPCPRACRHGAKPSTVTTVPERIRRSIYPNSVGTRVYQVINPYALAAA